MASEWIRSARYGQTYALRKRAPVFFCFGCSKKVRLLTEMTTRTVEGQKFQLCSDCAAVTIYYDTVARMYNYAREHGGVAR